ncbi:MAG: transcriptional regulator PpsR [Burkholderiaceae bacterium]
MSHRVLPPERLGVLSNLAPELAQTFALLSSDIALVIDDDGIVRNVVQGGPEPMAPGAQEWVGRPWVDTVTDDARAKIASLLQEVDSTGLSRKREINHPGHSGASIAVAYTAIRLGESGPVLAVGRDLRAVGAIQQRFLEAQKEMERGYWRVRMAEARYRLLFQVATDAVMVVEPETLEIMEANLAASQLFELSVEQVVGRPIAFGFESHSRGPVKELMARARASGQPAEIRARLSGKVTATSVVATPFRTDDAMRLLVRVRTMDMPGSSADLNATLARLVDSTSDGVVVTDSSGRIMVANPAFLRLVQMSTEEGVKGRPLMDWIGVSDQQLAALLMQVRRQGIARRIGSRLMSANAQVSEVEISAALLTEGDQECIGFTIHLLAPLREPGRDSQDELRLAIEQLTDRIGTAPLPELLHAVAELAQRHFFRSAMEKVANDAGAAARLLGVEPAQLGLAGADVPQSGNSNPDAQPRDG